MPVFKVNVKWGKEKFSDVECDTDEPPVVFKAQIFALSGVQPDRQKVMIKGTVIKDDDWGTAKLKQGANLLMMGSADELPKEPAEQVLFIEDMSEEQLASALELPAGLTNLGNTCYMNATLQCLRSIPELKTALQSYSGGSSLGAAMMPDQSITAAIRDLFTTMERTSEAVPPIIMLNQLHMSYPQFAEKDEHGHFSQQDANECWTELVRCLQKRVPALASTESSQSASAGAMSAPGFIDQYIGGEFAISMKCVEAEDEAPTKSSEKFYQLSCFIDKEVKYINTGLKGRLEEHITKNSPSLGRDAQYLKTQKISRLPAYLPVQMVRFFYKEKEAVNAKILKDIKFPIMLDVYDLCTPELQKKLLPIREKFQEVDDMNVVMSKSKKKIAGKPAKVDKEMEAKEKNIKTEPFSFADDQGSNNSGFYELQAVLTHKGRSSSSGHYVAWVKKKGDEWLMFDDDQVSPIEAEDILRLSGGGDWHCAYVLLYGPRVLAVDEDEVKEYRGKLEEEKKQQKAKEAAEKKPEEDKKNKVTPMDSS